MFGHKLSWSWTLDTTCQGKAKVLLKGGYRNIFYSFISPVGKGSTKKGPFRSLLVHWSIGPLVHWSIGPLVHWFIGPLWLNVKCQMSIRLNFCRSVPPELLRSFLYFALQIGNTQNIFISHIYNLIFILCMYQTGN